MTSKSLEVLFGWASSENIAMINYLSLNEISALCPRVYPTQIHTTVCHHSTKTEKYYEKFGSRLLTWFLIHIYLFAVFCAGYPDKYYETWQERVPPKVSSNKYSAWTGSSELLAQYIGMWNIHSEAYKDLVVISISDEYYKGFASACFKFLSECVHTAREQRN